MSTSRSNTKFRGRGTFHAGLRSRGSQSGSKSGLSMRGGLVGGTKGEGRGSRQLSSENKSQGARHTSPGPQPQLKPPPNKSRARNETWRNPASVNTAIQRHAGRLSSSHDAGWRNPPFDNLQVYNKQMTELYQTVCVHHPCAD